MLWHINADVFRDQIWTTRGSRRCQYLWKLTSLAWKHKSVNPIYMLFILEGIKMKPGPSLAWFCCIISPILLASEDSYDVLRTQPQGLLSKSINLGSVNKAFNMSPSHGVNLLAYKPFTSTWKFGITLKHIVLKTENIPSIYGYLTHWPPFTSTIWWFPVTRFDYNGA